MKVADLVSLGYTLVQPEHADIEIMGGYTSDLLSDVMANAKEHSVLITIQSHKNTVAVATLLDLPAIIICNGKEIPEDVIDAAKRERVAMLETKDDQFTVSHKVSLLLNNKAG